ncbi:MAG: magnesium transporter [Elusimicrobiota bacterium]
MNIKAEIVEKLKTAIRSENNRKVKEILTRIKHVDIAAIFEFLEEKERVRTFKLLSFENKVKVLEDLSRDIQKELVNSLEKEVIGEVLNEMEPDNRADLFAGISRSRARELLGFLRKEEADDVKELLEYGEETAGGRMTTEFIALNGEITARRALITLQKKSKNKKARNSNIYAVYTVDETGRLEAGISLQRLITSRPDVKLKELARPVDRIKVNVHDDQEQVAHLFAHYDLLSVPVADENNKLVGVITIDDIVDVIQQEASEDMALHAGMDEIDYQPGNIGKAVRTRGPWLMTSFAGGVTAAIIIGIFEGTLEKVAALAVFIPIIMDMGGNVGVQSSTVVVRRLALEKNKKSWRNSVAGELRSGIIMSVGFGLLLWLYASWQYTLDIGLASGLGIAAALALSTCMGAFLPVIFYKKNMDPAVATGPLITTAIDVLGLGIYFLLALWIVL